MLRILSTIRARERWAVIRFRIFPSTSMKITEKTEIKDFFLLFVLMLKGQFY